jgi:hypothetical protein
MSRVLTKFFIDMYLNQLGAIRDGTAQGGEGPKCVDCAMNENVKLEKREEGKSRGRGVRVGCRELPS